MTPNLHQMAGSKYTSISEIASYALRTSFSSLVPKLLRNRPKVHSFCLYNNPCVRIVTYSSHCFAQFPEFLSLSLSHDGNYCNSTARIRSNTLGIQAHRITIDGSRVSRIHSDTRTFIEIALVFSVIRNYAMLRYISIIINSIVTMLLAHEHIYIYIYICIYNLYIISPLCVL